MTEEQKGIGKVGENGVPKREYVKEESDIDKMEIKTWFQHSFSFSLVFVLL